MDIPSTALNRAALSGKVMIKKISSLLVNSNVLFLTVCILVVSLPPLIYGPYLPLTDLIGYLGLHNYPSHLSFGPEHYYPFQFSYFLFHIIFRIFNNIGISPAWQIVLTYLLQAFTFLYILHSMLKIFVPNLIVQRIAFVVGLLFFWNGMLIWGGPPFVFGTLLISFATLLSFQEQEGRDCKYTFIVFVLCLLGSMCHPFIVPLTIPLLGYRLLFLTQQRWKNLLSLILILLFALLIASDSPGSDIPRDYSALFATSLSQIDIMDKISRIFNWDMWMISSMINDPPSTPMVFYYYILGGLNLLGFLLAIPVLFMKNIPKEVKHLAIWSLGIGMLYFCSLENDILAHWPQRIRFFYSPLTYVSGISFIYYVCNSVMLKKNVERICVSCVTQASLYAFFYVIIIYLQIVFFKYANVYEENYAYVKNYLIDNAKNSSVSYDIGNISPFYLRAIPHLLFSDKDIIQNGILLKTEWHYLYNMNSKVINALNKPEFRFSLEQILSQNTKKTVK